MSIPVLVAEGVQQMIGEHVEITYDEDGYATFWISSRASIKADCDNFLMDCDIKNIS